MRPDRWTEHAAREWDEARRERTKIMGAPNYRALTAEEFDRDGINVSNWLRSIAAKEGGT